MGQIIIYKTFQKFINKSGWEKVWISFVGIYGNKIARRSGRIHELEDVNRKQKVQNQRERHNHGENSKINH